MDSEYFEFLNEMLAELRQGGSDMEGELTEMSEQCSDEPRCECGAESVGSSFHSNWCPLKGED
jgi:hypothetical protein